MATYILGTVGTALGGPIGGIVGAILGAYVDRQLISALTPNSYTQVNSTGPRLTEMSLTTSTEGAIVPRLYGRCRMGGQVIWVTQFKEVAETTTQTQTTGGGGKGGGGGGGGSSTTTTTTTVYKYFLSFAVAFCEGNQRAQLGRVWLDSTETDLSKYNFRFYTGSDTQSPDALIQAKEGSDNVPAFRGVTYIVFEELPLEEFGNRMPQVTAELVVPLLTDDPDDLQTLATSFQMIPASGESVYGTQVYSDVAGGGSKPDNVHNNFRQPDAVLSTSQLTTLMPSVDSVSVVVGWFGDDLRADQCRIIPKVERHDRTLSPTDWAVASYTRAAAELVSVDTQGRPVYGGTPSDAVVREYVTYLKGLGKRVVFYPFILMDITSTNTLPNPYSNGAATAGQPAFPWRGRITCSPAIGYTGSPDKTATAGTQVDTFFTRTEGYRAMALHYASLLSDLLGANDGFVIGSELVGLTTVRSSSGDGTFPAVQQLKTLAADVSTLLTSGTKVGYAADWSEYHSYRPADGTNDVIFNMDPLWSDANVDFVGIDNYLPIADWRDGSSHLDYDAVNGPVSIYDRDYLKSNIEGGEYYDWYYASSADRDTQTRTNITDGDPANEPWIYRQKDIRNWWGNAHHSRPGGVRNAGATSFSASTKPVWFTEFGCPAIDKAANQPNVFYDPKSSESFFPYYSTGSRDDWMQRLYLEVMLQYWRDNGGSMVSTDNMFIWTWDARPFPDYPIRTEVWSDGALWLKGHWLSGRADSVVLARLVRYLCNRVGLSDSQIDTEGLYGPGGLVRGLFINSQTSERDILDQLAQAYQFKGFESEGKLKFLMGINTKIVDLNPDDLVLRADKTFAVSVTRGQEIDLPKQVKITYLDEINSFQPASVDGQKGTGSSQNVVTASFPLVLTGEYCRELGTSIIHQAWTAREHGEFALPHSYAMVEQGDGIFVPSGTRSISSRVDQITLGEDRGIEFTGFDTSLFSSPVLPVNDRLPTVGSVFNSIDLEFMDLPILSSQDTLPWAPRVAAYSQPWPGGCNVLKEDGAGGFILIQQLAGRAIMGETTADFYSGPVDRWDYSNELYVNIFTPGELSSLTQEQLLAGTYNAVALHNEAADEWEVMQFASATLLSPGSYKLTTLLRGQLDTVTAMADPVPSGARIVLLQTGLVLPLNVSSDQATAHLTYRWGPVTYASDDATYVEGVRWGNRTGLRPYSPCDFRLQLDSGTGDLGLSWKRRTRYGGDSWDQTEVPLNEETEQYELVILSGPAGTVKRTEVLSSPEYTYTAADQTTDFGSTQTQLYVQVRQYGASYGDYGHTLEGWQYVGSAT